MADRKIHIPGEQKDGVQRCVRCGARLDDRLNRYRPGWDISAWPVGQPLSSDGRGNMGVGILAGARECGKKKSAVSEPASEVKA